ncbi:Striatin-interacting protein 2 [Varanus komodoensis]|nr:Striatin-interacting protein 2 [Varanus komodoensis]
MRPSSAADPEAPGDGSVDCPNLEFEYGDTDCRSAELSELYSYTEESEFALNRRCFEEDFQTQVKGRRWSELDLARQKAYVMRLLDGLEVVNRDKRLKVARVILYLAQGVFGECDTEAEVLDWARHNNFLLYQMGTFTAFLELLSMEMANSQACSTALRKPAISLADSTELRVLLSVMYLMVESIRVEMETDPPAWQASRETFRTELSGFLEEPFALLLFTMVTKFCSGHAPHFPMKKVLLLLWKVLVVSEMPSRRGLGRCGFSGSWRDRVPGKARAEHLEDGVLALSWSEAAAALPQTLWREQTWRAKSSPTGSLVPPHPSLLLPGCGSLGGFWSLHLSPNSERSKHLP